MPGIKPRTSNAKNIPLSYILNPQLYFNCEWTSDKEFRTSRKCKIDLEPKIKRMIVNVFSLYFKKVNSEPSTSGSHCNPSCYGGREQEGCSSKPAQANSLQDPIFCEKKVIEIGLVEWLKV
jgi:hypothetical protein